jgi:hypothetical protein
MRSTRALPSPPLCCADDVLMWCGVAVRSTTPRDARQLILTALPRLVYVNTQTMTMRGVRAPTPTHLYPQPQP